MDIRYIPFFQGWRHRDEQLPPAGLPVSPALRIIQGGGQSDEVVLRPPQTSSIFDLVSACYAEKPFFKNWQQLVTVAVALFEVERDPHTRERMFDNTIDDAVQDKVDQLLHFPRHEFNLLLRSRSKQKGLVKLVSEMSYLAIRYNQSGYFINKDRLDDESVFREALVTFLRRSIEQMISERHLPKATPSDEALKIAADHAFNLLRHTPNANVFDLTRKNPT